MTEGFLADAKLPFCKGCGHHFIADNTEKALQRLGMRPLDVILVTDIGCHGVIDENFLTHTVHGLHGRAVALAAGISAGLNNPDKKVVVYLGDGGATIGLQHLLDVAHRNFNLTVVLHNNFLYGMTGGQPSGLTPKGFNTPISVTGNHSGGYDICRLLHDAGADYVNRIVGIGDFSETLAEAFEQDGFSLVEIVELCPSYGVKHNPGMKITRIEEQLGIKTTKLTNTKRKPIEIRYRDDLPSLLDGVPVIETGYMSPLTRPFSIILGGSAGEGVQSAAGLFANAAMMAGLQVTKKASYPVTVGVGYSTAEIIVSPTAILFTGISEPDVVIITSQEGLDNCRGTIAEMRTGILCLDESLQPPQTHTEIVRYDFRGPAGARSSALSALLWLLLTKNIFPMQAMRKAIETSKISATIDLEKLLQTLSRRFTGENAACV
jgi:pyruvate/2-oxoacid:ferredoxin oxidoreductase beta subunit/Pyruvate/2-oxoacid:ferredoxin oxidoreductase gamma subunit